jgi:hypothetical protein
MAVAVTVGDLRGKSKTTIPDSQRYGGDIPLIVGGVERGVIRVEFDVPDERTNAEVLAALASGMFVRFNL